MKVSKEFSSKYSDEIQKLHSKQEELNEREQDIRIIKDNETRILQEQQGEQGTLKGRSITQQNKRNKT
jgi:hypothetical protein